MLNHKLGHTAQATGTVDAIEVDIVPIPVTLHDGITFLFRALGRNTITNPTVNANGTGAKTLVKHGGAPLQAGDIPDANAVCIIQFDFANDRYELLNPGVSGGGDESDLSLISTFRFLTKN